MRSSLFFGLMLLVVFCPFSLLGDSNDETQVTKARGQPESSVDIATADTQPLILSLTDVVELALKNNLNIGVERYTPRISRMGIIKAEAEFDPEFAAGVSGGRTTSPGFSTWAGETALAARRDKEINFEAGFNKKFPTGATGSVLLYTRRLQTNRSGIFLNPSWASDLTFALTQPLLKGFGQKINEAEIIIARNNEAISVYEFHSKVLEVLSEAQEVYWDLVLAYEDLEVQEYSLELAEDFLEKNKKRVEAGVLAPIETLRPQAELAAREEGVVIARSRIQDLTDELRNILNLNSAPPFGEQGTGASAAPVNEEGALRPADNAAYEEAEVNLSSSIKAALENRPDYAQAKKDLENLDISLVVAKNATLPQLDLAATYNINGLGGSLGNDVDMLATPDFFDWEVGVNFAIPLGNRKAKSEYLQAKWEKEKALLGLKSLENDIVTEVKAAVREVATNLRRIETNRRARELAEERLKAEEKRFELGLGSSLDVLEAQKDVTSAQSAELEAIIDYNIALVQLAETEGTLIAASGVAVEQ
jgi:outer membrane protein TolC